MVNRFAPSAGYASSFFTPENIKKAFDMGKKAYGARRSLANAFKALAKKTDNGKFKQIVKSARKKRKVAHARNHASAPLTKAASRIKGATTNHARAKEITVTKDFKDKVVKALADKTCSGSWDQISFDTIPISNIPLNGQAVNGLGAAFTGDYSNWAFDPEDILHAASVLWNNKSDSQGNRIWTNSQNLGIAESAGNGGNVGISDLKLPGRSKYGMNVKITVKRCHEVYKMKNESQRTITLKIYLCEPRRVGVMGNQTYSMPLVDEAPATSTDLNNIGSPAQVWDSELRKQKASGMNMSNSIPSQLYNKPNLCPVFNKTYKTDETTVVLEPGQVYDYYINGPTNYTMNFSNFFQGAGTDAILYNGVQKFMRYPLFTAYVDLVSDGTTSGRYPTTAAGQGFQGIAVERHMKMFLECPSTVGGGITLLSSSGIANGAVESNYKRDCYFKTVYTKTTAFGISKRFDVQDPGDGIPIDES